jgi:Helix-turn-helix domain
MSWINLEALAYALEYDAETATQRIVLFELAYHSDDRGYTWPSSKFIAIRWRLDRKTVRRQIGALIGRRAIFNTKKRRGNTRQIKVYRMPKFTWERGSQSTPLSDVEGRRKGGIRGAKGGHSLPRTRNKEQGTNDDDIKTWGSSLACEQQSTNGKSSSFFLNFEEAMKHPRWEEFNAHCKGSGTVKGFNTWLPKQAPLKPRRDPKRNGARLNYEAEMAASEAKADRENGRL